MDCMEGMAQFPDKYFDLAIIDPPYGIGADHGIRVINKNKTWNIARDRGNIICGEWDKNIPQNDYWQELYRITENQIIWGGNYFNLPQNNNWIIWDKEIKNYTFSPFEMAWSSTGKCKIFRWMLEGYKSRNPDEMQNKFHPTQKPVALYKWLLKNYAKPEFKIIDTHAGSCSSVIAFLEFGCQWIAFEIDNDYYEAASKRIEVYKAQLKLF